MRRTVQFELRVPPGSSFATSLEQRLIRLLARTLEKRARCREASSDGEDAEAETEVESGGGHGGEVLRAAVGARLRTRALSAASRPLYSSFFPILFAFLVRSSI